LIDNGIVLIIVLCIAKVMIPWYFRLIFRKVFFNAL